MIEQMIRIMEMEEIKEFEVGKRYLMTNRNYEAEVLERYVLERCGEYVKIHNPIDNRTYWKKESLVFKEYEVVGCLGSFLSEVKHDENPWGNWVPCQTITRTGDWAPYAGMLRETVSAK